MENNVLEIIKIDVDVVKRLYAAPKYTALTTNKFGVNFSVDSLYVDKKLTTTSLKSSKIIYTINFDIHPWAIGNSNYKFYSSELPNIDINRYVADEDYRFQFSTSLTDDELISSVYNTLLAELFEDGVNNIWFSSNYTLSERIDLFKRHASILDEII